MLQTISSGPRILLFGHDEMLLRTRQWMLRPYATELAGDLKTLSSRAERADFDLVIVCHTASSEECKQALELLHIRAQDPDFLVLLPMTDLSFQEPPFMNRGKLKVLRDIAPAKLVQAVSELLELKWQHVAS